MHIISTILVGFIVGVIAKFIHPSKESMGFILTELLGLGGSFVAKYAA